MAALTACACVAACVHAAFSAPPAPGAGYGAYERTIEDLPDVHAALIDDDGTVYASLGSGGIVRIAPDGQRSTLVAWWPAGQVASAGALVRGQSGGLIVADTPRAQILSVSPQGGRTLLADLSVLTVPPRPAALCVDSNRILVADGASPRILVLDAAGTAIAQWEIPVPRDGNPPRLRGITSGGGHVFVSDAANNRIVRLDPTTGTVTAEWGDRGAFPKMFESPAGLAWDGQSLVVTDTLNHRVVRYDTEGKALDQFGMHAVRPREGKGKIHYPVTASPSPDGNRIVVAEPFERRVQVFGHQPPPDPKAPRMTPLPANDGIASHFSTELSIDGQTLLVYEPESASALIFDMRASPPIHVTTLGGPGRTAGHFGQVSTQLLDEKNNRVYLADPLRGVIIVFALRRDGAAPHFDAFMGRLVAEIPLDAIARFTAQRAGGPPAIWPLDLAMTTSGGFVLLDGVANRVVELDSSMRPVNAWSPPKGTGRLIAPTQLAVTQQGEVVIVDSADRALKRYGLSDGSLLGVISIAEAKRPWGLATLPDATGVRYVVSDAGGDALLVVDASKGIIVNRIVATGEKPGEFWEPGAMEFQPLDGRMYVCDHGNHRLQSFQPDGTWESSFGIGRPYVRPRDPNAPQTPVTPVGTAPSAEGAANTLAQFPAATMQEDGWFTVPSNDGNYTVRWRMTPSKVPLRDPFGMDVRVLDKHTGQPSEAVLSVSAMMPHHGHGMNVAPSVTRGADATYRVENMLFHMPGYWEIYFDLTAGGRLERAQSEVTLQ